MTFATALTGGILEVQGDAITTGLAAAARTRRVVGAYFNRDLRALAPVIDLDSLVPIGGTVEQAVSIAGENGKHRPPWGGGNHKPGRLIKADAFRRVRAHTTNHANI
jgi:hypothetical protein